MSDKYSPKSFLRATSNDMLAAYFQKPGLLAEFDFSRLGHKKINELHNAICSLPGNIRQQVQQDFQDILWLSHTGGGGITTILQEAEYQGIDLQSGLSTLLDLRLDKSITKPEYDKKAQELKERQYEVSTRLSNHEKGDESFRTTVEALFALASQAYEIFESSKIEQKRQLIAFVFSNLRLRGATLEYNLRNPFHLMPGTHTRQEWLGD